MLCAEIHVFGGKLFVGDDGGDAFERAIGNEGVVVKLAVIDEQDNFIAIGSDNAFELRLEVGGVGEPAPDGNAGRRHDRDFDGKRFDGIQG